MFTSQQTVRGAEERRSSDAGAVEADDGGLADLGVGLAGALVVARRLVPRELAPLPAQLPALQPLRRNQQERRHQQHRCDRESLHLPALDDLCSN